MIRTLAGLAPFQLAFVVNGLETAAQRFEAVLGAGPWRGYLFDETAVGGRLYHGRPAASNLISTR